jgi:hypothetical protein
MSAASLSQPCSEEYVTATRCISGLLKCQECFDTATFEQTFQTEVTNQFLSTFAFKNTDDPLFCDLASQRVCDYYAEFQSCCCEEETTLYRKCIYDEIALASGAPACTDTCESKIAMKEDTTDTSEGISIVLIAGIAGGVLFLGALIVVLLICRRRKRARGTLITADTKKSSKNLSSKKGQIDPSQSNKTLNVSDESSDGFHDDPYNPNLQKELVIENSDKIKKKKEKSKKVRSFLEYHPC